jgi:type I restriction enzyme, R subunit
MLGLSEADTCRVHVTPKLQAAGWDREPHLIREQRTFTDGRIIVAGDRARRRPGKRADYLLCYRPDFTLAVVEAKAVYRSPADGMQQAKAYAETLGLKFAYATNGEGIVEFDFITGTEREIAEFPSPDDLWARLRVAEGLADDVAERLLTPAYHLSGRQLRYYQEIAVNRAIQAVLQGRRRSLRTMATGTGKTVVAFQVCWKLSEARWNRTAEYRSRRRAGPSSMRSCPRSSIGPSRASCSASPTVEPTGSRLPPTCPNVPARALSGRALLLRAHGFPGSHGPDPSCRLRG